MDSLYSVLQLIYVVICVLLLFGAAVFVHEFGHFWVALKCGMKVEEFAIGFGRKIKSWKRNGIEYSIRWIPAGGFVRLPQMVTSQALEGASEEPCPPAAPWKRILTAFAGPGMNIVFGFVLAVLLYFVGLPIPINPPIIGPVAEDSVEYQKGIRENDLIVSVDGTPVKSWEETMEITTLAQTNVVEVITKRGDDLATNYLTLAPRKDLQQEADINWKQLNLDPKIHVTALDVIAGGAGDKAGLKNGDAILFFNDAPIFGTAQLVGLVQANPGKECKMVVQRPLPKKTADELETYEELTLTITPADMEGHGRIAVNLGASTRYVLQKPGPLPWERVWYVLERNYKTIVALCNSSKTGVGAKDLSGPPGILAMLATYVKTDYRLALDFMILLNVSLAILNLLPVPVLDGGHIVMSLFEWVTGKAVSIKFLEYVNTAFAILLIGFMLYVSYNDIKKANIFVNLYKMDSQVEEVVPATGK